MTVIKALFMTTKTAESICENDLLPFKAGIEAGASSVLVAHNTVNALDSDKTRVTFADNSQYA